VIDRALKRITNDEMLFFENFSMKVKDGGFGLVQRTYQQIITIASGSVGTPRNYLLVPMPTLANFALSGELVAASNLVGSRYPGYANEGDEFVDFRIVYHSVEVIPTFNDNPSTGMSGYVMVRKGPVQVMAGRDAPLSLMVTGLQSFAGTSYSTAVYPAAMGVSVLVCNTKLNFMPVTDAIGAIPPITTPATFGRLFLLGRSVGFDNNLDSIYISAYFTGRLLLKFRQCVQYRVILNSPYTSLALTLENDPEYMNRYREVMKEIFICPYVCKSQYQTRLQSRAKYLNGLH